MSTRTSETFFSNGTQYYIAGRYAAFAGLNPVTGNLFHHSIEMLLKGGLSKEQGLPELKKLGHDLLKVWDAFKCQFGGSALDEFDNVISTLNAFEELRYPDTVVNTGMACSISIKSPSSTASPIGVAAQVPQYNICLEDIDRLTATIFRVASMNPKYFIGYANDATKQWLDEENKERTLTTN